MAEKVDNKGKTKKRYTGKVKWLDTQGVGYIIADDNSEEYLVTPSSFAGAGFRTVRDGDQVKFAVKARHRKPRAVDVVLFGPECSICRTIGHFPNNCPEKNTSRVKCHWCWLTGHSSWNCNQERPGWHPFREKNGSGGVPDAGGGTFHRVGNGGRDDDRKLVGSMVCVKRREDVKKVEAIEDCFILEFDPTETGNGSRSSDDDDEDRKAIGHVVCVKNREDVKKVEEVEDCFILEFDPTKIVNGSCDFEDYNDEDGEEEKEVDDDDDDGDEEMGYIVCVKKVEDVKKVEEVEDCFILEFDPTEPVKFSNLSLCGSKSEPVTVFEEDVFILAEKGQVACRDYPHPRHLCARHPFRKTPHEIHCEMCYCYACDIPAPCAKWTEGMHCNASDEISMWTKLRDMKKMKSQMS